MASVVAAISLVVVIAAAFACAYMRHRGDSPEDFIEPSATSAKPR